MRSVREPELRGLRILVTGATGMIGFPLCRALAGDNEVVGAARLKNREEAERLVQIGVTPVPCDVGSDLEALPAEIDVVFHLAAFTPVRDPRTLDNQRRSIELNSFGTARLLSRYRRAQAFVFASTGSVYAPSDGPLVEDHPYGIPSHFQDGYALSKIIAECLLQFLAQEWHVPTTILRIFSMYGPEGGAPTVRIDRVRRHEPIAVHGQGDNHNTVMFEDDYVEKLMRAATVASVPPVVTNFGGSMTSIQEYCTIAAELLGTEAQFVDRGGAAVPHFASLALMNELLGPARTTVREGVARVIERAQEDRAPGWDVFTLSGD